MLSAIEEQQLRALLVRNIDMHGRRVVNATDAVNDGDYITKGQSQSVVTKILSSAGFTTSPSGLLIPLNVEGLSGLLADPQTPLSHATSHETLGSDEVNVSNLTGLLDEPQEVFPHGYEHENDGLDPLHIDDLADPSDNVRLNATTGTHGLLPKLDGNVAHYLDGTGAFSSPAVAPALHATSHESGGNDEVDVQGQYGLLSHPQDPMPHGDEHGNDGLDPIHLDDLADPYDNTNLDVSITRHGLTPKLPNDVTKYLDGTGAYSVPAGGSSATSLLGITQYAPAANTIITVSSTTWTDLDSTNLKVTFTTPASGKVLVRLTAWADLSSGDQGGWGLRESTTNLAGVGGVVTRTTGGNICTIAIYLTGLSAGSHTYKWSAASASGGVRLLCGPGNNGATIDATKPFAPAVMEVWSA